MNSSFDERLEYVAANSNAELPSVFDITKHIQHAGSGEVVTLGDLIKELQYHSFFMVLLALHLVNAIPIPNPAISVFVGISSFLIALQVLFGRKSVWIPAVLSKRGIKRTNIEAALAKLEPKLQWIESKRRVRLRFMINKITMKLSFAIIGILSLLISTLFPMGNFIISIGVSVICLAIMIGDGMLLLTGLLFSTLGILFAVFIVGLSIKFISLIYN
jgi:hypothetical protein